MTTIPQWVPPLPSRADLANQRAANEITKSILGEGSPIPVIVGEAQVGGRVFAIDYDSGTSTWTVGVAWCFGEVQSVVATYLNGAAPVGGVTVNTYTGTTTQTADALLSAAISGYTDTLVLSRPGGNIGVCYSVYQYTDSDYSDFPQIVAQIQGLKTNGGAYSTSPVRALQFLIEDSVIGLDLNTDATSFNTAATQTDTEIVAGEKRREIGLVIDNILSFDKWITILAGYCSAWVNKIGDTYYLTPDRPRSSDATLTSADWAEKSFGMTFADKDNTPTAVEVVYTDPTETIWRDRTVRAELTGVSSGTVPERISRVQMPGVTRYSQAIREANERLDKLNLTTSISFDAFDDQLGLQLGDVITVSRGTHLSSKLFRVTAPPQKIFGEGVRVQATEYDATVYSDSNPADPTFGANNGFLGDGVATGTGITTFYEATAPTANATGDLWFDTDDDSVSRWNGSTWELIQDNDIAQALSDASTAQTTADGKIVTFVQTSAPTAEGTGDLWFDSDDENKLYRWSGSAWVEYAQDYAVWANVSGANKPEDNATQNTGALADLDTVDLTTTAAGGVSGLLPTGSAAGGLINSNVTINADGTLSNAGAGQVTLYGLDLPSGLSGAGAGFDPNFFVADNWTAGNFTTYDATGGPDADPIFYIDGTAKGASSTSTVIAKIPAYMTSGGLNAGKVMEVQPQVGSSYYCRILCRVTTGWSTACIQAKAINRDADGTYISNLSVESNDGSQTYTGGYPPFYFLRSNGSYTLLVDQLAIDAGVNTWLWVTGKFTVTGGTAIDDIKYLGAYLFGQTTNPGGGRFEIAFYQIYDSDPEAVNPATAGRNLFNNAGTLLNDVDVENDNVVGSVIGGSLVSNPAFSIVRAPTENGNTNNRSGGWFYRGNAESEMVADGDTLAIDVQGAGSASGILLSSIWRVNPNTDYEVTFIMRSDNSDTINLGAAYIETSLPSGYAAIVQATTAVAFSDPEILGTNTQTVTRDFFTNETLTTSFVSYTYTTEFPETATYASLDIRATQGEHFEIDSVWVRDKSTLGSDRAVLTINVAADGTANNGEAAICGVTKETPDFTKNGFIYWGGSKIEITRNAGDNTTIATGRADTKGLIALYTGVSNVFNVNGVARKIAFVQKVGSQWQYDNNTSWVDFTPDSDYLAIGWLQTGTADTIDAGGFFEPVTLTLASFPVNDPIRQVTGQFTMAGDLSTNPFFANKDAVTNKPAGIQPGYFANQLNHFGYGDSTETTLIVYDPAESDTSTSVCWPAFAVAKGMRYRVWIRWRFTAGATNSGGLYFRFMAKEANIAEGKTHVSYSNTGTSTVDFSNAAPFTTGVNSCHTISCTTGATGLYENKNVPSLNTWYETVLEARPELDDPNAEWMSFTILNWTGLGAAARMEIDSCVILPSAIAQAGNNLVNAAGTTVADGDFLNSEALIWEIENVEWKSFEDASIFNYSPSDATRTGRVRIRDALGNELATRTVSGTVTVSSGSINITSSGTVDGITISSITGDNTTSPEVNLSYNAETNTQYWATSKVDVLGVGK